MPPVPPVTTHDKIPHPSVESLDLATIMRTLGLPMSTGSYHLRLLREAGVTRTRAEGTQRLISLRRDDLEGRFPGLVDVLTG